MNASAVRLVNPLSIVKTATREVHRQTRPSLDGAILGVVTNVFRGEDLPGAVGHRIMNRYGCTEVVKYVKPILSHPADKAEISRIAQRADAAIVGVCG